MRAMGVVSRRVIRDQQRQTLRWDGVMCRGLRLAERAGARNATQHEEAEVAGVDGRGIINKLTCVIVVIERLSHKVDVVNQGLTRALLGHEAVQE